MSSNGEQRAPLALGPCRLRVIRCQSTRIDQAGPGTPDQSAGINSGFKFDSGNRGARFTDSRIKFQWHNSDWQLRNIIFLARDSLILWNTMARLDTHLEKRGCSALVSNAGRAVQTLTRSERHPPLNEQNPTRKTKLCRRNDLTTLRRQAPRVKGTLCSPLEDIYMMICDHAV